MDTKLLTAIICVLIFLVIYLLHHSYTATSDDIFNGFWVVSEDFKEKSNIEQLIIYFGQGKGYLYDGYIIATIDKELVFNETIRYRISPKSYFKANIYDIDLEKDTGFLPKKLTLELYPSVGGMELKCLREGKVYAYLYKDNQMSAKTLLEIREDSMKEEEKPLEKPADFEPVKN